MRSRSLVYVLAMVLSGIQEGESQSPPSLQSIYLGSQGGTTVIAPEAEADFEEIQTLFVESIGMRPKGSLILELSRSMGISVFERIGHFMRSVDSTDIFIGVCRGGWQRLQDHLELSSLIAPTQKNITAEYLVNMMHFAPARNGILFLLAPARNDFPLEIFDGLPTKISVGGKYVVVLTPKGGVDYSGSLDMFNDILDDLHEFERSDRNGDGNLSFSDWLLECARRTSARFNVMLFRLTEAEDPVIRKLR